MDQTLSQDERKEYMELLKLPPAAWGNIPMMKKAYKTVVKTLHPDKGGDSAKMQRLNELHQKMQSTLLDIRSNCGTSSSQGYHSQSQDPEGGSWGKFFRSHVNENYDDLYCSETISSEDEEEESDASSTPGHSTPGRSTPGPSFSDEDPNSSQHSFCTPPKKRKVETAPEDFPDCLDKFLSHALYSNKTLTSFCIYTTLEKSAQLYKSFDKSKICVDFKSRFLYKSEGLDGGILFILTLTKHRASAVKTFCSAQCTQSFLHCKGVTKPLELYQTLGKTPFKLIEENKAGLSLFDFEEGKEQSVNWLQVCQYANATGITDVMLLLGIYLDFAADFGTCDKCAKKKNKFHYNYHEEHQANARLFLESKNQKNLCQQAVDQVLAGKRLKLVESTRIELMEERMLELFEEMDEKLHGGITILRWMAAVAWYTMLIDDAWDVFKKIMELIVENKPKKRNVLIKGPLNCGKTTLASAFVDFFGGKTLNINCPQDRLSFELGMAIDAYMVLFDDVKGQIALNKNLQPGQGINNLDNLRDHMDGTIKVNLERKHSNKVSQLFPPCLMTMNDYLLPPSVGIRFSLHLHLRIKDYLKTSLQKSDMLSSRMLNSGLCILLCLIWYNPVRDFTTPVQDKVVYWKQILEKYVSIDQFGQMQQNILDGKDPLDGLVIEEE
ncbi:large T antigen [Alphapolyomavirus septipanos]|uniref:Large T antigen n=1 Tax=Alphapolyomavirus septipanos TaxID=1891739 RepID=K7QLH1_9POLY|nr:large T antigen [Alphapolyomavirus septipanos]AFU25594.1 large T antigen [Alphapolyomavirus septipanos]